MTWRHLALCASFVAVTSAAYAIASGPAGSRGALFIAQHLVLTALMLATWATSGGGPSAFRWTLAAGAVARVILIAVPPFTSHDVSRYLWDGHAALSAVDPYRHAPDAVSALATGGWTLPLDNTSLPTLYPPGALALFAACASFGAAAAPLVWRLLVLAASLGVLWVTASMLRVRSLERHLPLVALSPLLVLEGGVGAHVDVLAALAVVAAVALGARGRSLAAGVALGLGGLVKLLPLVAVLPLALATRRRGATTLAAAASMTVATGYGLAIAVGLRPVGSLFTFLGTWRFGSPIPSLLDQMVGASATPWVAGALAVLGLAVIGWRGPQRALQRSLSVPLVVSPVVHPWYLAVLAPLQALEPSAFALSWLAAQPLTYEVLDRFDRTGQWHPAAWALGAIAVAWIAGLAVEHVLRRTRGSRETPRPVARLHSVEPKGA